MIDTMRVQRHTNSRTLYLYDTQTDFYHFVLLLGRISLSKYKCANRAFHCDITVSVAGLLLLWLLLCFLSSLNFTAHSFSQFVIITIGFVLLFDHTGTFSVLWHFLRHRRDDCALSWIVYSFVAFDAVWVC